MIHDSKTVTRFAPSPTGHFHLGSARTALFNYLFAKQQNGAMLLRIEDTDASRSRGEYETEILQSLEWLGLSFDALFRQSERGALYAKYLKKMLDTGSAYESKEEREGETSTVIRFKNPKTPITFRDEIRGDISFETESLGDFVIARSLENPLYHFAVVVDDFEMGVTMIIRGDDHISNTPRHILLQRAIGAPTPLYTHIPLVLSPDRSRLSKRHGAKSILEYRDEGYLSRALFNFLVLLGWSPQSVSSDIPEVLTEEEIIRHFSISHVQKSAAIFNIEKLNWLNKEHMKKLTKEECAQRIRAFLPRELLALGAHTDELFFRILPVISERIEKFSDIKRLWEEGELRYFFETPEYEAGMLVWKDTKNSRETALYIDNIIDKLSILPSSAFIPEEIKKTLWAFATEKGRGNVLWPMRYALSGKEKSPDPFVLASVLGKDETIKRLKIAQEKLKTIKDEGAN